jgi:hypothetical protein
MIKCCEKYNTTFEDVFHNPKIPHQYKYAKYHFDKSPQQHIVDKWHWFYFASYTQIIDGMLLYARIRKGETKETSYTLDAISTKELGKTKIQFEDSNDHYTMQTKHFARYVAYNIADAILLQLLNYKTKDFLALGELTGVSAIQFFGKPMNMLKDIYYDYYLKQGLVLGSVGENKSNLASQYLKALGGTVLPSYLIKDTGLRGLKGFPTIETYTYMYTFDIDYSSIYPNTKVAHNISKDTKLSTLIDINGTRIQSDIEKLFSGMSLPVENSVNIGHKFFNLPNYTEMEVKISEYLFNLNKDKT